MSAASDFRAVQTTTGWGQVLAMLAEWCRPQPGWHTLDVGCGPGLLPALLAARGCQAGGVELDPAMLRPSPLHPGVARADALHLPLPAGAFDLVTASNLLFLLPAPQPALAEMRRVLAPGGQVVLLNPSERMSLAAATAVADRRDLHGTARESLLNWAARAEAHARWSEADLHALLAAAGLRLVESELTVGPGLARLARGVALDAG